MQNVYYFKNKNDKENSTIINSYYWNLLMTNFKIVKIGGGGGGGELSTYCDT